MKRIETMSLSELEQHIKEAETLLRQMTVVSEDKKEVRRRKSLKSAADRKVRLEAESEAIFDKLEVGDMVRVDGVRNKRYPYRLVTEVVKTDNCYNQRFTGWQYSINKNGVWSKGKEHTSHMSNKIREVIKKEDLNIG